MTAVLPCRREFLLSLVTATAAAACGGRRIPPPTSPSPGLMRPSAAIPEDLDVALRADLDQVRRAFGPEFIEALEFDIGARADAAGVGLLKDALRAADTVWIALRPESEPRYTDNVVILRGKFGTLFPGEYAGPSRWQPALDLGAAWRLYERKPTSVRAAPARLYAHADDLLIFVSEAEIDSTERSVELQAGDAHVEPPDRGTVSLALRVQPLLRWIPFRYAELVRLLEPASRILAHATVDTLGARAEIEIAFLDADTARLAADAASLLISRVTAADGALGTVARGASATAVGNAAVVRIQLSPEALADILTQS